MKIFRSRTVPASLRHERYSAEQRPSNPVAPYTNPQVRRLHRVLVVDEKAATLKALRSQLRLESFEVLEAMDEDTAFETAVEERPALIIMDLAGGAISGIDLYHRLRKSPATEKISVLILSARSQETDKVNALELGVDDYVTKPFSPREVALRVKAILRYQIHWAMAADFVKIGDIEIDRSRYQVKVGGDVVELTPLEFGILGFLGERRGQVQTRRLLLDQLWGFHEHQTSRTIDSHIRRLRAKLGAAARQLVTIRGFGYRLDEEAEEACLSWA